MELMKPILLVASGLLFAGCAGGPTRTLDSTSRDATPRYATPEEIARLQSEARANFERERQGQGASRLAIVGSGPASSSSEPAPVEPPRVETPRIGIARVAAASPSRRSWSAAESRYALQIGKAPGDLTAGERAVARSQ